MHGCDLMVQTLDAAKAEFPKDVQVTRGWIVVKVAMTGRKSGLFQKSPRDVVRAFTRSRHVLSSNHAMAACIEGTPKEWVGHPIHRCGHSRWLVSRW